MSTRLRHVQKMQTLKLGKFSRFTQSWIYCALQNALLAIGFVLIMYPIFETNDDASIVRIVDGSHIISDSHTVFSNFILGHVYRICYAITNRLPWYTLFQYFIVYLSLTVITWILVNTLKGVLRTAVCLFTLLFMGYECYARIQFTKTASLAACASLLLLLVLLRRRQDDTALPVFDEVFGKRRYYITACFAMLLGIAGSLIRFDAFLSGSAMMIGPVFYTWLRALKEDKKDGVAGSFLLHTRRYLITFGILFAAAFALHAADRHEYASSAQLSDYELRNDARYVLLDFGLPDYKAFQEKYEALGITRSAWKMLQTYNFADPDVFTADVMYEIASWRDPLPAASPSSVRAFFGAIFKRMLYLQLAVFLLAAFLIWLTGRSHGAADLAGAALSCILFFGVYYYLYLLGRYQVYRVDVGIYFSCAMGFIWMAGGARRHPNIAAVLLAVCAVAFWFHPNASYIYTRFSAETEYLRANKARDISYASNVALEKDHLYLAKVGTVTDTGSFGVFETPPLRFFDNLLWLGGWETWLPACHETLEEWGIHNPFRDMINNDRVLLIDGAVEDTLNYLHDYYAKDAEAIKISEDGPFGIYRIVSNSMETASSY